MKFVLTGGALAFLFGISLPGFVLFIGASIIAIFTTIFICNHVDIEFEMIEKTLISLLLNACLAIGGVVILPETLGFDVDNTFAIIVAAGSLVGTFLGGIFSEFYEPKR